MALLDQVHWEVISAEMREVMTLIGGQEYAKQFYLAGGTGLALQMGHRRSMDLDFFSENDQVLSNTRQQIIQSFNTLASQVIESVDGHLLVIVNNLQTGFFSYGYPLLEPLYEINGTGVASIADIGLMKLDAMIGRGSRKDFYDIYYLTKKIPLLDLLMMGEKKFTHVRDFALMVVESMVMFENADRDRQPDLFAELPWENVRNYFSELVKESGKKWFTGEQ